MPKPLVPLNPRYTPFPNEGEHAQAAYEYLLRHPDGVNDAVLRTDLSPGAAISGLSSLHCRGMLVPVSPVGSCVWRLRSEFLED